MKSLLWLPLTAVLVLGCNDSPDEATAPAAEVPGGGSAVDLDNVAVNLSAQVGLTARCVQLRYVSETGAISTRQRGTSCACLAGRPVSVTAVLWGGAQSNNAIGKAFCGGTVVAGPATAVDPAGSLGLLFGIASVWSPQTGGAPAAPSARPSPTRETARTDW
jgi:hypothetical protein